MKMDKIKKLTAIYNDYVSIETDKDLKKRKLTLAEYQAFPSVFKRYQDSGEARTFVTAIADYFKKYGFSVSMDENHVNYIIQ